MKRFLDGGVFGGGVEAGAGFGGKIAVGMYAGLGIGEAEIAQELQEGGFLGFCAGVGGLTGAVGCEASCVGYADAVGVVAEAVRACLAQGASGVDCAVKVDEIVVADGAEASLAVPEVDFGHADVAAGGGGGAVDDDFGDGAHGSGRIGGCCWKWSVVCVRAGGVVLAKLMPGMPGFSAIMRRYRKFLVFLASHFCVFKF